MLRTCRGVELSAFVANCSNSNPIWNDTAKATASCLFRLSNVNYILLYLYFTYYLMKTENYPITYDWTSFNYPYDTLSPLDCKRVRRSGWLWWWWLCCLMFHEWKWVFSYRIISYVKRLNIKYACHAWVFNINKHKTSIRNVILMSF